MAGLKLTRMEQLVGIEIGRRLEKNKNNTLSSSAKKNQQLAKESLDLQEETRKARPQSKLQIDASCSTQIRLNPRSDANYYSVRPDLLNQCQGVAFKLCESETHRYSKLQSLDRCQSLSHEWIRNYSLDANVPPKPKCKSRLQLSISNPIAINPLHTKYFSK
ncbi:hypothetical protein PVK06_009385 [Gossypium arboreum]|uniref:Uncharacterized protein n=1 Tax=Gossypium arboreum TaxID=29729 RepID=A0ABR0QNB5_GOSAR|nr:hypothetical protein PVK06_009385 [Gossypium arboreum]